MDNTIPTGYMKNSRGHMVPDNQVREQDKLRNQVVIDLVKDALLLNIQLADFKRRALNDIADLVSIAAQKYDVQIGGKKGNVNLMSYDGQYKIVRSVADRITFTEELEAAKQLITQCIDDWTQGSSNNVRALVDRAFKTNSQGQIKTGAVLDLIRLDIQDENWIRAMQALKDSIQVNNTTTYIRIYQRIGMSDQYAAVPLDIAAVRA